MLKPLLLGALLLVLTACVSPDSYRMNSGDMGDPIGAALAKHMRQMP